MYSRRPLGLDLTRTPLLHPPSPSIRPAPPPHSSSSSLKVKDVPLPPTSFRPPFLTSLPLPARTAQPLPLVKGDNNSSSSSSSSSSSGSSSSSAVEKPAGELWPLDKSGSVPLITPIQGPDLRSVVFYQSLLRHHPAYRQLLEGFLVPPFQPFLCPPLPPPAAAAAVIADVAVPFAFCTPPPPLPRHHPHHPHHHHHHHHHPNNNNNHHPLSSSVPPEEEEEDRHRRRAQLGAQLVVSPQEKKDVSSPPQPPRNSNARGDRDSGAAEERSSEPASEHHHHPRSPQGGRRECEESKCSETGCLERSPLLSTSKVDLKCSEEVMRGGGGGGAGGGVLSAEDLVASITAIPDPYQQYGYGRKLFPCPQCRYTTDRRNNLKRHMLTMHQLSAKMLECCGLLFRTKAALREHALIFHYHGYTCFYCARRFCRKALLKRHLSVHSGQKEFLCNVCDYATSHKSNLERHRRVHMRQDDDVSFEEDGMMMMMEDPRETSGHLSEDEISVCSHDEEDEEINVHSD